MHSEFVDAYAHCGVSKYKPLADVEAAMQRAGVDRAVLVQHLGEFDNSYLQRVVEENPQKFAAVCLVDHASAQAVADLERWAQTGRFRGVRLLLESLAANRSLWVRAAELNLNIVAYAPSDVGSDAERLNGFLQDLPSARIVLSHLGLGHLREEKGFGSHDAVFRLVEHVEVYFQVSGMHMFCDYPFEPIEPLVTRALGTFGADRMLWGGNYPVVGNNDDYVREAEMIRGGGFSIAPDDVVKITRDTALKIWF